MAIENLYWTTFEKRKIKQSNITRISSTFVTPTLNRVFWGRGIAVRILFGSQMFSCPRWSWQNSGQGQWPAVAASELEVQPHPPPASSLLLGWREAIPTSSRRGGPCTGRNKRHESSDLFAQQMRAGKETVSTHEGTENTSGLLAALCFIRLHVLTYGNLLIIS